MSILSAAEELVSSTLGGYLRIAEYATLGVILSLAVYLGWHLNGMRSEAKINAQKVVDQQNIIAAKDAVAVTEHTQVATTMGVSYEYQKALADINARYDSMLANGQASAGNDLSKPAASASGAVSSSCTASLSLKHYAELQTAQLVALQSWVCKQGMGRCK